MGIEKEEQQAAQAKAEAKGEEQTYQQDWSYQQDQPAPAIDAGAGGEWGATRAVTQEWGADATPAAPAAAGFGAAQHLLLLLVMNGVQRLTWLLQKNGEQQNLSPPNGVHKLEEKAGLKGMMIC